MIETITSEPAGKRGRNGSVNLTDRMCEKRVTNRVKIYDKKCPGLFVSVTTAGVATFSVKFTDPATGKQRTGWLGVYNPDTFAVEHARAKVYSLKGTGAAAIAETFRDRKAQQAKQGKTVDAIIEERIDWMKTPVKKADGEMRPRLESWSNTASHLRRFVGPRLGKKVASEITKHDIAGLSNDIVAGKLGVPSIANARHMRRATSAMFRWAAQAGRDYVSASPCIDLPPLDAEHARTRVLSEAEIRTLWHGLDRTDLPVDRKVCLAIKLALTTMLRSTELLHMHRDELNHDGIGPVADIPAKRVKKRRVINQPLSDLAMAIITEAMGNHQFVFTGRYDDAPLSRTSMGTALRGRKDKAVKQIGLCELLGLKPFTPHDLRRTAATICGRWFSDAEIAPVLDHQPTKDANGKPLPAVTGKHYNHAQRKNMEAKRKVLDRWTEELRRIIAEPVKAIEDDQRLAA